MGGMGPVRSTAPGGEHREDERQKREPDRPHRMLSPGFKHGFGVIRRSWPGRAPSAR